MSYPYQIKSLEQYHQDYKKSAEDPEGFWGNIAENFQWRKKWDKVLDWNFTEPKIEWFKGGKLNITEKPQDGRFTIAIEKLLIEIRTSSIPAEYGESLVMRILNPNTLNLETLGLRKDLYEIFNSSIVHIAEFILIYSNSYFKCDRNLVSKYLYV